MCVCLVGYRKSSRASIIGSEYNPEKYGKRGRFKGIARNSESNFGFNVTLERPIVCMYLNPRLTC